MMVSAITGVAVKAAMAAIAMSFILLSCCGALRKQQNAQGGCSGSGGNRFRWLIGFITQPCR
jgi:hypothetical protein